MSTIIYNDTTFDRQLPQAILEAAHVVHQTFDEEHPLFMYSSALGWEFDEYGIAYKRQEQSGLIFYGTNYDAHFIPDFIIKDLIILGVADKPITDDHICIFKDCLRGSGYKIAFIFYFGLPELQFKRFDF